MSFQYFWKFDRISLYLCLFNVLFYALYCSNELISVRVFRTQCERNNFCSCSARSRLFEQIELCERRNFPIFRTNCIVRTNWRISFVFSAPTLLYEPIKLSLVRTYISKKFTLIDISPKNHAVVCVQKFVRHNPTVKLQYKKIFY